MAELCEFAPTGLRRQVQRLDDWRKIVTVRAESVHPNHACCWIRRSFQFDGFGNLLYSVFGSKSFRHYASIRSNLTKLPPRMASLSASLKDGDSVIRSIISGQLYGMSDP